MEQIQNLLHQIKLWQCSFAISISLLTLGFTGSIPFTDVTLLPEHSTAAMRGGVAFFIGAVILRYIPPPKAERQDDKKNVEAGPKNGENG